MGDRKAFEAEVLKWTKEIDPSGETTAFYQAMFSEMSDKDIEEYVNAIERGEDFISAIYTNLGKSKITVENNFKVAKKMKHEFFERLWITDPASSQVYLTPIKYLVVDLPVRRQVQMLTKKMSVPDDNLHVDELTNQPTDVSKGSAVSFPELLVLYSQGMDKSVLELIKVRGGDQRAYNAMEKAIAEQGAVKLDPILAAGTRVKSTETLGAFLQGMMFDNTI